MTINEIRKKLDEINYWDCKALDFTIQYFGDEAEIVIEIQEGLCYSIKFLLCHKVKYETDVKDRWKITEVRNMSKKQLGYYVQDITVKENEESDFIEVQIIFRSQRLSKRSSKHSKDYCSLEEISRSKIKG